MGPARKFYGRTCAWVFVVCNWCWVVPLWAESLAFEKKPAGASGRTLHSLRSGWCAHPLARSMGSSKKASNWLPRRGGCWHRNHEGSLSVNRQQFHRGWPSQSKTNRFHHQLGTVIGQARVIQVVSSTPHGGCEPIPRGSTASQCRRNDSGVCRGGWSVDTPLRCRRPTSAKGSSGNDAAAAEEKRREDETLHTGDRDEGDGGDDGKGVDDRTAAFTALASISILVSYADRGNLASAIVPMAEQFGWSQGFEGLVLSAFFGGYAATQMLGGWLADRFGGRQTLMAGLAAWSVFTLITPLAAAQGSTALLATRVGLGLGEGFAFPSVHAMIAENVPRDQRSTVVGYVTAASYAGALVAFSVSPAIMRYTGGWEAVFQVFGGGSLLLLPAWLLLPLPLEKGRSEEVEQDTDELSWQDQGRMLASVVSKLGTRREVWAILIAQFCQSVGMFGLLSWLPTYLHDVRGLAADSSELGTLAAAPYAIQAVVGAGAGLAADRLISEAGWRVKSVRQIMQMAGMLGAGVSLCAAVFEPQPGISVAWIVLGAGLSAITLGGVSVNHLDVAPQNAGLVFGAGNTAGTIAGLLTVPFCGWLLETYDSWDLVFLLFAASYVIGALAFFAWVGDEVIT